MQIKKDNSKKKIKSSAKKLFFVMQYKDASMRDVAKMSDMTVGNIYRYYENKEILFEDIVGETYRKIEKILRVTDYAQVFIKNKIGLTEKNVYKNSKFKSHILGVIVDIVVQDSNELYILINNSEGSKYENTSERVGNMIKETITAIIPKMSEDIVDAYAYTAISTLSYILKTHIGDKAKLKEHITLFFQKFIESFS